MHQLTLQFDDLNTDPTQERAAIKLASGEFSHNRVCAETARLALESRYAEIICETDKFSRRTVSFQSNKVQLLHNWIKYREGFSSELVERLLDELDPAVVGPVLDPFAGSCTTLLQARLQGRDAIGIELLPHCHLAWEAKSRVFDYDIDELQRLRAVLATSAPPQGTERFPHITITDSAFPPAIERDLVDYRTWLESLALSEDSTILLRALLMSILEDVSYTRKDGQYLRWDDRADKIQQRNRTRVAQGKPPFRGIDKGPLPSVQEALLAKLDHVIRDIGQFQRIRPPAASSQRLHEGNTLFVLPTLAANSVAGVITSPPYANRYDYTRTYALELAYLSVDRQIFDLRQGLLSCTVENKSKLDELQQFYASIGAIDRFERVAALLEANDVLQEIVAALTMRNQRGEINNSGVLRMIENYFSELAFVFMELYRICRPGARVAFVNDNVRYAGEVIPVDTISTRLAQALGFEPLAIYVIPQRKGNSSQQMKRFGRRELRKSITIWQKPL